MLTRSFAALVLICAGVGALYFFGQWIPNRPPVSKYPLRGIDVSHHQGKIDWTKVARAGQKFAYIKATEGTDFRDSNFPENWAGARAAGITPGAYHFFRLGVPAARQAEVFVSTVPREANTLPLAIDLEFSGYNRNPSQSAKDFQQEFAKFVQIVTMADGRPPLIYTMNDFRRRYFEGVRLEHLWIREIFFKPTGTDWMLWQFSSRGQLPGIDGYVDLNVFRGNTADFQNLVRTH